MHRATKAILLCLVLFLALPGILSRAEGGEPGGDAVGQREEILSGRVRRIAEQREFESMGHTQVYQKLELTITEGPRRGEAVIVEQGLQPTVRQDLYRVGDAVYLVEGQDASGNRSYYIVGRARWRTLAWVFFLFVVLVVLIGRGRGAMSLVGMGLSFVVIRFLILPHLSGGEMSVMTTVLGAALAMPGGYYLAHGLNWKTTIALLGSFLGLGLTGALAAAFVGAAHLSGFASEEMSL
ncbi:MAG: YibE/F family protein, partial [Chloroflexi bacterium]|nr:YibE/F family protein [Chloroflexota bacterium]